MATTGHYYHKVGDMVKPTEFIKAIKQGAIEAYKQYGILPSVKIAQAALESSWGQNHIQYNLFGIKWTEKCGYDKIERITTEYINGKRQTVKAYFRGYKNFDESILDHSVLLNKPRYAKVKAAKNYIEACNELQAAGYATDPHYAEKLISIIEIYKLYEIDEEARNFKELTAIIYDWDGLPAKVPKEIMRLENGELWVKARPFTELAGGRVTYDAKNNVSMFNFSK